MKKHPLLSVSAVLFELHSLLAIVCTVYFSVFNVMLAEEVPDDINIWIMCLFLITAMLAVALELVSGRNALNGDSLMNLRQFSLSAVVFNACAWFSGASIHQVWFPFPIGIVIGILFITGVKKTVEED